MKPRSIRLTIGICLTSLIAASLVVYSVSVVRRTSYAYDAQKQGRGWVGRVHEADPELGFRAIPRSRGAETFLIGSDVAVHFDADGFRIPADHPEEAPIRRPLCLALGCSFTYGAACAAEETYPWLVAKRLNGTCVNAAICSYGLSHMLLLARTLVPKYQPDYVLFQYSPWLVTRSQTPFAPIFIGSLPTPFFEATDQGPMLRGPLFRTIAFDVPVGDYLHTPRSRPDFLSFLWRVGLPVCVHDDWHRTLLRLKGKLPARPREQEVLDAVHAEVAALCAQYRARMVIVVVGQGDETIRVPESIAKLGCLVVDASTALKARLPDTEFSTYVQRYAHWRGDPPVVIDGHPNPLAHSIIADEIVKAIETR